MTRLSNLLREWDKGGRGVRNQILTDFVAQCRSMTGPQLEKALGNGASLLLARISSWLRLSYALGSSVALQLRAISVFVAASSGQRFLAEFVEVGGQVTHSGPTLSTVAQPQAIERLDSRGQWRTVRPPCVLRLATRDRSPPPRRLRWW